MVYVTLLATLAVFTVLDILTTAIGLRVGLVELNPIVMMWGVQFWAMFRTLLLVYILTVFSAGYWICLRHFPKGLTTLKATLFALDSFIGTVVFSGFLGICLKLLF